MTPRIRKAAVVASSVAVLGAAGIGVAAAADSPSSSSGTTTTGPAPAGAPGGPGRDHRGPGPRGEHLAAVAKTLGVTAEQLRTAVRDARPEKADRPKPDPDARVAELAKALGVEASKVREILEANRPARPDRGERPRPPKGERRAPKDGERPPAGRGPGGPGFGPGGRGPGGPGFGPGGPGGPRGDDSKLVAALAKGLSLSEAKVKAALEELRAAHEKEHDARRTAFYAAVAKTLGKDAAAVQKAFEAERPKAPATP